MGKGVDVDPPNGARRKGGAVGIWLSLLGVFVAASGVAVLVPWWNSAPSTGTAAGGAPAANSAERPRPGAQAEQRVAVVCVQEPGGDDFCHRVAADVVHRAQLTQPQRAAAEHAMGRVRWAVINDRERRTRCSGPAEPCQLIFLPAGVEQVRRTLAAAGFHDAMVRAARADDPAPVGAVLFAVPAGPACVLGYLSPHIGTEAIRIEGRLPDGACLTA